MAKQNTANHASGLPALDNRDLQILLGTRLSEYAIQNVRRTLPINLFLNIDMDVDLCGSTTYLCESQSDLPNFSDSAIDSQTFRYTIEPPKTVTFSGFCKGSFETKLAKEQMQCINQSDVLRNWYTSSVARMVEDGKEALHARFLRHLTTNAVHPANTGNNAGQVSHDIVLGTKTDHVQLTPETIDVWVMALLRTMQQMPRPGVVDNEFGFSGGQYFMYVPQAMESLMLKNPNYNQWNLSGEASMLFKGVFDRHPRGIMPIMSHLIEPYKVNSGGNTCKVYPVLFGIPYQGSKASLRIDTDTYESPDKQSHIFRTDFYRHIHTFNCRYLGVSWVSIEDTQPITVSCT